MKHPDPPSEPAAADHRADSTPAVGPVRQFALDALGAVSIIGLIVALLGLGVGGLCRSSELTAVSLLAALVAALAAIARGFIRT